MAARSFQRTVNVAAAFAALMCALSWPATAAVPARAGWTLQFSDDFNGPVGHQPDRSLWIYDLGHGYPGGGDHWGTHEVQSYTADPRNIGFDGRGHLRITALRDAEGQWTSARIETRRDDFHAPEHGLLRLQARMRFPAVHGPAAIGYWPAFWALGKSFRTQRDWPAAGEIDVAENVNGLDRVWGTMHCGVKPGGPCHEKTGLSAHRACPKTTCQASFHTYAFEWDRTGPRQVLRWYVDDVLYHTLHQDDVPAATWQRMTTRKGMFVLFNLAIGGEFPDHLNAPVPTPTAQTEPGHSLLIDYVAVWTRIGMP